MEKEYLYGFNKPMGVNGAIGSICIIPTEYWEKHHIKLNDYIYDNNLADEIESLGLIESMQNTFEFDATKMSREKVVEILSTITCVKYSKEFEDYLLSLEE